MSLVAVTYSRIQERGYNAPRKIFVAILFYFSLNAHPNITFAKFCCICFEKGHPPYGI